MHLVRTSRARPILFLCAAIAAMIVAEAQADAQTRRELRQDRRELRQDRRQMRDDGRDLSRLQVLRSDFERARAARDIMALRNVDARLQHMMRQETREGRRELRQDRSELRRSRREVRSERRDRRHELRHGHVLGAAEGTRDLRGDRRDRRDDRRDLAVTATMSQRRLEIGRALAPLYGRYDAASLSKKSALIDELVRLAQAERRQDHREHREDRRERREDRREIVQEGRY